MERRESISVLEEKPKRNMPYLFACDRQHRRVKSGVFTAARHCLSVLDQIRALKGQKNWKKKKKENFASESDKVDQRAPTTTLILTRPSFAIFKLNSMTVKCRRKQKNILDISDH